MKRILSIFCLVAITAVIFVGCSKDNKYAKRLDGTWNVTSWMQGTTEQLVEGISLAITFTKCKTKDEWCTGSQTFTLGTESETTAFEWQISEKGTVYTTRTNAETLVENYNVMTIDELTKKEATMSWTDDDGVKTTMKIAKE